jgi:hypothetical protein
MKAVPVVGRLLGRKESAGRAIGYDARRIKKGTIDESKSAV